MQLPTVAVFKTVKTERVGSVGAVETTLLTITIPPNTLRKDGDALRVTAATQYAANVNVKTGKLYVGVDTIASRGGVADSGAAFYYEGMIVRTGAFDSYSIGRVLTTLGNILVTNRDSIANDWSTPIEIKLTGQGVANDDVISRLLKVEYVPADSTYE